MKRFYLTFVCLLAVVVASAQSPIAGRGTGDMPPLSLDPLPAEPIAAQDGDAAVGSAVSDAEGSRGGIRRFLSGWQIGCQAGYINSETDWLVVHSDGTREDMFKRVSPRHGFTAGMTASLPFAEVWSLDTGISVSLTGFEYDDGSVSVSFSRYALMVPLMVTFFESNAYIPVFVQAGIMGGVSLGGRNDISASGDSLPGDGLTWWRSAAKLSFGFVFGIGYRGLAVHVMRTVTPSWSRAMRDEWERVTGDSLSSQMSTAFSITYTYWF